jgi:hypothetical protein
MLLGLGILATGIGVWAFGRHHPPPSLQNGRDGPPLPRAVAIEAPPSQPVLELAWVAEAKGPVIARLDGDAIEDLFGFVRVWDGRSAWTMHAGAFSGATLAPLWRTEPLDPWLIRKADASPMATVVGKHVVVADGTSKLRVYGLSGAKEATYLLSQAPHDLCAMADGAHVWIDAPTPLTMDVGTGSFAPATAASSCHDGGRKPRAATDAGDAGRGAGLAWNEACRGAFDNRSARAACLSPGQLGALGRSDLAYALVDGDARVAFTQPHDPESQAAARALAFSANGKVLWERAVADAGSSSADGAPPRIADVVNKTLYVVYARKLFDARVEAIELATGRTIWEVPLVGSLPPADPVGARGAAVRLVVTDARVYVARAGGGLDVFDARTGATVGTIGNGDTSKR